MLIVAFCLHLVAYLFTVGLSSELLYIF